MIIYTIADSPLGYLLLGATKKGLCISRLGSDKGKLERELIPKGLSKHEKDFEAAQWTRNESHYETRLDQFGMYVQPASPHPSGTADKLAKGSGLGTGAPVPAKIRTHERRLSAVLWDKSMELQSYLQKWVKALIDYLENRKPWPLLPYDVPATVFQRRVWDELRTIPSGTTCNYSEAARLIGRPAAARAVARACATNPIALVIPCHRIVPKSGGVGGYRWSPNRKRKLLELEGIHIVNEDQ